MLLYRCLAAVVLSYSIAVAVAAEAEGSARASSVKVAAIRVVWGQTADEPLELRIRRGLALVEKAADQGAKYVLLPENFLQAADPARQAVPGPLTERLADVARRRNIYICAGIVESVRFGARNSWEDYLSAVLVGPKGYIATHRKVDVCVSPQTPVWTAGMPKTDMGVWAGEDFRMHRLGAIERAAVMICRDTNSSWAWSRVITQDPQIVFSPNLRDSIVKYGCDMPAMAKKYGVPIVAASGHPQSESMIIDRDGRIVDFENQVERALVAEVALADTHPGYQAIEVVQNDVAASRPCLSDWNPKRPNGRQVCEMVQEAAAGSANRLAAQTPDIEIEAANTPRQVPMVHLGSPWQKGAFFELEVPEYSWAKVPGDAHSNDPFFYGRQVGLVKEWVMRYPPLAPPRWQRGERGLSLDVPLGDSDRRQAYVQRFRVIPRDRLVEVWFGVTNLTPRPLTDLRCQLCAMSARAGRGFTDSRPTSSRLLSNDRLVSWDAAGQDLSWIESHRDPATGRFRANRFFTVPDRFHIWPGYPEKTRAREDLMMLNQPIDLPAIVKHDPGPPARSLVIYSPCGRDAFFNCLVPCFHADPFMDEVPPGLTRWTVSFFILHEGDVEGLLRELSRLHEQVRRNDGFGDGPGW